MTENIFKDLFVLDLANNHQGDLKHGNHIINEFAKIIKQNKLKIGIKFQFRNLKTYIDKNSSLKSSNKHVKRFKETELSIEDYKNLKKNLDKHKIISICTPFDEASVDNICELNFDILKIASCSASDWPLLEKAAESNLPILISTAGLSLQKIDDIVSFFDHKGVNFALMHCVAIYPTPDDKCNLNKIDEMIERYPKNIIGWSTHEEPNNMNNIQIAYAKGARIFERHIGLKNSKYSLNKYSSTPSQITNWLNSYKNVVNICSSTSKKNDSVEQLSLHDLKRGIFSKVEIKKGQKVTLSKIEYRFPLSKGQISVENFKSGLIAKKNIKKDKPIKLSDLKKAKEKNTVKKIKDIIHDMKAMLNIAKIHLNSDFKVEYSHHKGVDKFNEIGCAIITCMNREYCKKIIIQIPGQKHPLHYHKKKEESFQILYGELKSNIDGRERILKPGDICLIQRGVWHSFETNVGCIFEEISTTHIIGDSFYKDRTIQKSDYSSRKTITDHWGRFELEEKLN